MENQVRVLGLMSGTSLDGLDVALCDFWEESGKIQYQIVQAETFAYSLELKTELQRCSDYHAMKFIDFHRFYGRFLGETAAAFLNKYGLAADYVSSHGHTIFHQPEKGLNFQLGEAAALSAACGLPVVADFRSLDVCLGGQGAPLVPIGDAYLFSEYAYRLNLGGFCNVSMVREGNLMAWDIGPFNMALNYLASELGFNYDPEGSFAATGKVNEQLLAELNRLEYYSQPAPKSLGREWFDQEVLPLLNQSKISTQDKLASFSVHIAHRIVADCHGGSNSRILITGGGAFNSDFISRLRRISQLNICIPDSMLVNYKEALIFAFLGYLRIRKKINSLRSVSGARMDSCGGSVVWHSATIS